MNTLRLKAVGIQQIVLEELAGLVGLHAYTCVQRQLAVGPVSQARQSDPSEEWAD